MDELSVRALAEDDWRVLREIRLDALKESPDAFVADHETEAQHDEDFWRDRIRDTRTFLAERGGRAKALIGLGAHGEDPASAEILGLWVAPDERRGRVARRLIGAATEQAIAEGRRRLYFWVGSDNGAAVSFASVVGFRPTSERRPTTPDGVVGSDDEPWEVAMVMALSADPRSVVNPVIP